MPKNETLTSTASLFEALYTDPERLAERRSELEDIKQTDLLQARGKTGERLHDLIRTSPCARVVKRGVMAEDSVWQASLHAGEAQTPFVLRSKITTYHHPRRPGYRVDLDIFTGEPANILGTYPQSEPVTDPDRSIDATYMRMHTDRSPVDLSLADMGSMIEDVLLLEALVEQVSPETSVNVAAQVGQTALQVV